MKNWKLALPMAAALMALAGYLNLPYSELPLAVLLLAVLGPTLVPPAANHLDRLLSWLEARLKRC